MCRSSCHKKWIIRFDFDFLTLRNLCDKQSNHCRTRTESKKKLLITIHFYLMTIWFSTCIQITEYQDVVACITVRHWKFYPQTILIIFVFAENIYFLFSSTSGGWDNAFFHTPKSTHAFVLFVSTRAFIHIIYARNECNKLITSTKPRNLRV